MDFLAPLLNSSRRTKKSLFFIHDIFLIALAFWLAIGLRVGVINEWHNISNWKLLGVIVVFSLLGFNQLGLYRTVIRYAGVKLIRQVLIGSLVSVSAMVLYAFLLHLWLPRSVPFSYFFLLSIFLIGSRFTVKGILQVEQKNRNRPIIIYGAGAAGRQLFATTMKIGDFLPIAFVDDNLSLHQQSVSNLAVYSPKQLPQLIDRFGVETIILAMPTATQRQRKTIVSQLSELPCQVLSIPNIQALNTLGEAAGIRMLQKLSIVDLLGRDAIKPMPKLMKKNTQGKVVMVTGAGGSIGAEICRQVIEQQPATLILFELSEAALYTIMQELSALIESQNQVSQLIPVLGTVNDQAMLTTLMQTHQIETVYHAAAYKHVPLVEYNTVEGVNNNVFGTLHCAKAAIAAKVQTFVLISTDKAVRPTSTMGATKRMAELVLQALALEPHHQTCFCMVRFGNVLGSSGSVIPLFEKQIAQGGPLTITHPEMTRFFMTIPEAAQLVIQAGAMATGGDVFVLDMGESVNILQLARQMVLLSGLTIRDDLNPSGDIEIITAGLRPGEKLYEELLVNENAIGTNHPRIMTSKEKMLNCNELNALLSEMAKACSTFNPEAVRECLMRAPTDFAPSDRICDNLTPEIRVNK